MNMVDMLFVFAMGCCAGWIALSLKLIMEDAKREREERGRKWVTISVAADSQEP